MDYNPDRWEHRYEGEYDTNSPFIFGRLIEEYLEDQEAEFCDISGFSGGLDPLYIRIRAPVIGGEEHDSYHDLRITGEGEVWTRYFPHSAIPDYQAEIDHHITVKSVLRRVYPRQIDIYHDRDAPALESLLETERSVAAGV